MSGSMYTGGGYMNSGTSGSSLGSYPPMNSGSLGGSMAAPVPPPPTSHHRESEPFFYGSYEPSYYGESASTNPGNFYTRPYHESEPKSFGPSEASSTMSLVQRLSLLIKSHLPYLQNMSMGMQSRRDDSSYFRQRSRSRSRDRRDRQRGPRRRSRSKSPGMDWLCPKCSFSNYEWRDRCKKCNESRATKNFMPGPEDWRCLKCNNINYARRLECNRCKAARQDK